MHLNFILGLDKMAAYVILMGTDSFSLKEISNSPQFAKYKPLIDAIILLEKPTSICLANQIAAKYLISDFINPLN